MERLSPAGKQLVEICRAIQHGSSLLIFDEPTSSLSGGESEEVFRIVRALRERSMGVIYITHRLEELRAIGDRVTILRDGATVHTGPLAEISTDRIIQHMVGRAVVSIYQREPCPPGEELLRVEGLTRQRQAATTSALRLRAGEIVGLAGLIGAGRTELCRAIFGVDPHRRGTVSGERQAGAHPLAAGSGGRGHRAGHRGSAEDRPGAAAAHRLQRHAWPTSAPSAVSACWTWRAEPQVTARVHRPAAHPRVFRAATGGTVERRQSAEGGDRQVAVPQRARVPVR